MDATNAETESHTTTTHKDTLEADTTEMDNSEPVLTDEKKALSTSSAAESSPMTMSTKEGGSRPFIKNEREKRYVLCVAAKPLCHMCVAPHAWPNID